MASGFDYDKFEKELWDKTIVLSVPVIPELSLEEAKRKRAECQQAFDAACKALREAEQALDQAFAVERSVEFQIGPGSRVLCETGKEILVTEVPSQSPGRYCSFEGRPRIFGFALRENGERYFYESWDGSYWKFKNQNEITQI